MSFVLISIQILILIQLHYKISFVKKKHTIDTLFHLPYVTMIFISILKWLFLRFID